MLWAWGAAQYPYLLLPGLTVPAAAAPHATLAATAVCTAVGGGLLIPSLGGCWCCSSDRPARGRPFPARLLPACPARPRRPLARTSAEIGQR